MYCGGVEIVNAQFDPQHFLCNLTNLHCESATESKLIANMKIYLFEKKNF